MNQMKVCNSFGFKVH